MIIGIDPGLSGAIGVVDPEGRLFAVWDTPTITVDVGGKPRRRIDLLALANLLLPFRDARVFIEHVGPSPRDSKAGTFAFGRAFGQIEGICAGFEPRLITPVVWKRAMGVPGSDKNLSRAKAAELFPDDAHRFARVKDDGRAEAALLALYGLRHAP